MLIRGLTTDSRVFDNEDGTGDGSSPSTESTILDTIESQDGTSGGEPPVETPKQTATTPTQAQTQQATQQADFLSFKANQQGDLVDDQGNIIARTGGERKFFEKALGFYRPREQALRTQLQTLQQRVAQGDPEAAKKIAALEGQVQGFQQANQLVAQLKIQPDEHLSALKLMAAWKSDKAKTINYLLTLARQEGIDISGVTGNQNQIDLSAITNMIDERLKPLTDAHQASKETRQRQAQIEQDAEREVNTLFTNYSDARIHEGTLATLVQQYPDKPLETLYWMLRNEAQRLGLDWNKPLLQQRQEQLRQQQKPGVPNPGVHGNTNGSGLVDHDKIVHEADPNTDLDSIVRESMREQGYNV